jgi:hypothetical protein
MTEDTFFNDIFGFLSEVNFVYDSLVLPTWCKEFHGLPNVLYGYMMGLMARIDIVSTILYKSDEKNQTKRMILFLNVYCGIELEAANVLVYVWRHKLMHTGSPQEIKLSNKISYYWLLHWKEHLPKEQHLTFQDNGSNQKILNISMIYLANDVKNGIKRFEDELNSNAILQTRLVEYRDEQKAEMKKYHSE